MRASIKSRNLAKLWVTWLTCLLIKFTLEFWIQDKTCLHLLTINLKSGSVVVDDFRLSIIFLQSVSTMIFEFPALLSMWGLHAMHMLPRSLELYFQNKWVFWLWWKSLLHSVEKYLHQMHLHHEKYVLFQRVSMMCHKPEASQKMLYLVTSNEQMSLIFQILLEKTHSMEQLICRLCRFTLTRGQLQRRHQRKCLIFGQRFSFQISDQFPSTFRWLLSKTVSVIAW